MQQFVVPIAQQTIAVPASIQKALDFSNRKEDRHAIHV